MKFTCTQENLNKGLGIVSHIANRNITLPILNNVAIKAEGGVIALSTTNLEIGITASVRGKIDQPGRFTVQARLIADYVNLLPKENVEVELNGDVLHLKCGNHKTSVKGVSSEDFPTIPEMESEATISLKTAELKEALAQVIFAVSVDETRPEISGVLFYFNNKTLTIVGTDSYRLAEKKLTVKSDLTTEKSLIIPLRTLQEVYRILSDDGTAEIEILINSNQILFKIAGEVELTSRLVEGQYPDYQQIIPGDCRTKAKVKTAEFIRVIKSASLFCKPGINDVKLNFDLTKGTLVVSSLNSAVGENVATVEVDGTGDNNEAVFNYRYLLDGLNNLDSAEVSVELVSESAPGILRPVNGGDYLYIIMPIRQ
ncbi:MAG: DNA polymerase III subunit beta [Candidatus Komeilibacteria bacterium]|nr:DNA polymerase III subunit beta [Candidatus Komeilibacteria bacterium]